MMSKKNLRPSYLKMKHVISVPHESSAENAKIMNAQVMTKVYRKLPNLPLVKPTGKTTNSKY